MHLFSVHAQQGHIRPRQSFFAYSAININFKGVSMKLKIVALCNFRGIAYFYDFFDFLLLSYKPSNFARAILSYAVG